ncbi:MAG: ATP-binding cassette domain-containing protein [Flavobacteriales bacterium]|nr:ATP-binding cassette domain-containing protein [Flavobacteriales bacterium]
MVTLTDLVCAYGDKRVLDIPSFTFAEDGVHGIVGLNGAGKTTLFNALYGFGRSKGAKVLFNGEDLSRHNAAFLESENYFYPGITGREYLDLFSGTKHFDVNGMNSLLQVPLDELITAYSTGMRRKLALFGVLKLDRAVVLLDEPMNGLDLAAVRVLEAIVRKLAEQGRTVFISSHMLAPLKALCGQIHLVQGGSIRRTYTPGEMDALEQALFADLDAHTDATIARSM